MGQDADAAIAEAAEVIKRGGLVAFPTETVYGLGADAFRPEAVAKVFQAKGRPSDNPLIIHVAEISQFHEIGKNIPALALQLAERFWPGPMTLVVEHRGNVPPIVTADLPTAAIRIPNHHVALQLIRKASRGIVGPSANLSGKPSPTTAQHVYDDLNGKVDIILDSGPTTIGIESTVIDVTSEPFTVLRFGGLTIEEIENVVGGVITTSTDDLSKRSPGTRHRHYAPHAHVELIPEGDTKHFLQSLEHHRKRRENIGCIVHSNELSFQQSSKHLFIISVQARDYANSLFKLLRTLDERGVDIILVETISEHGLGAAIMDRLRKASDQKL